MGGQSPHEIRETTRALLADVLGDFKGYSGDFLKVNHFRRCLALDVRDPRVGNYRVSTCVASRVSRRYHYKPIQS